MDIPPTKPNIELSKAVNSRVAADARMTSARAILFTMGGWAMLALGIGAGIGLALWGYARTQDVSTHAETIAAALTKALTDSKIKLDENATVRLDANGETVGISPNSVVDVRGTVALEPGARVALDPNARVRIDGPTTNYIPRPTTDQLGPLSQSNSVHQGRKVNTNFTVFKFVAYNQGQVVTGYQFVGDETKPKDQYCYFSTEAKEGASLRIDLAKDSVFQAPKSAPRGFNSREAASNCVWFDGSTTRFW